MIFIYLYFYHYHILELCKLTLVINDFHIIGCYFAGCYCFLVS